MVTGAALLKPKATLVGLVPVVNKVVNPASLYQEYVLPPDGVVITGGVIASPTQYVFGAKVTAGATGMAFTVNVTEVAGLVQLLLFVSVTKTVIVAGAALVKPNAPLVGFVPVVNKEVRPASLYHW